MLNFKRHCAHTHTHRHGAIPLCRPPTRTPTHALCICSSRSLLLKKLCSVSMLMYWQSILVQNEASLMNPNSPGTGGIRSQALAAVTLQKLQFDCNEFFPPSAALFFPHFPNVSFLRRLLIQINTFLFCRYLAPKYALPCSLPYLSEGNEFV